MALPQDGQNANALATVKEVPTGKKLIFVDPTTNEGGVITLEDLTTQILKNLTSQTFALDQGTKTLPAALNELNSKVFIDIRNLSTFSVNIKLNTYTYASFLMYGATSRYNGFMYIVFVDVASEKRTVNFIKIADFVASRTFSGTYSDDTSTLTINASETIWGGIKMLMLK
ncbi:hypothetical protein [Blautia sp.]|jgi:hypothetical protein|uniref:hypothetical protein n=1 Tax=Blautia sp. TaxID=1955243 RepID=UPI003FD849EA